MGIWNTHYDPYIESASGIYTGRTPYTKFGRRKAVPVNTIVDVWNGPTNDYTFTSGIIGSAGVPLYISSDNILDTQTFLTSGINELGYEQEHTQTIEGQTKLRLGETLNWFRFWRAITRLGDSIIGNVYIYEDTTVTAGVPDDMTKVRGFIDNGNNQTQMAIWTMPINERGALVDILIGMSNKVQAAVSFEVYARVVGGVFALQGTLAVNAVGTGAFQRTYRIGRQFFQGTDFIIKAISGTVGVDVVSDFDIKRRLVS